LARLQQLQRFEDRHPLAAKAVGSEPVVMAEEVAERIEPL
jgi:hypothetical protein